nr:hypothetical protein [Pseudodesulfovibrio sp.]
MSWDWIDESNAVIAIGASPLVLNAGKIHEVVNDFWQDFHAMPMEDDDCERWYEFYRNRRKVYQDFLVSFEKANPLMTEVKIHPGVKLIFSRSNQFRGGLSEFAQKYLSFIVKGNGRVLPKLSLGMRFVMQIIIPCWIHYGESPGAMYRKARRGDLQSFLNLLKLDKNLFYDRMLSRKTRRTEKEVNSDTYQGILLAMGSEPKAITIRKVKILIGALIYRFAQVIEQPLSYPELRKIFDECAKDMGLGVIDTDLQESDEAFAKALKRAETFWEF